VILKSVYAILSSGRFSGMSSVGASYLGEQRGPDGLNLLDLGSLDQGLELVGLLKQLLLVTFGSISNFRISHFFRGGVTGWWAATHSDLDTIIGEDEGRVGRSELGGRHCDWFGGFATEGDFADVDRKFGVGSIYEVGKSEVWASPEVALVKPCRYVPPMLLTSAPRRAVWATAIFDGSLSLGRI